MPNYDYHCTACGHKCEVFQKITEEPHKLCPHCGKEQLRRGPGGGLGIAFTGTGWYKTDYGNTAPKTECCPCGKNKGSCGG